MNQVKGPDDPGDSPASDRAGRRVAGNIAVMADDRRERGGREGVAARVAAEEDRIRRLEAAGLPAHPEAAFLTAFDPRSVLELGCGTGRISIELARRGVRTVGVDADRELLEVAARRAALEWIHGVPTRLHLRDAAGADRRFDAVICAGRLLTVATAEDRVRLLAVAAGHLHPGGLMVTGFQVARGRGTITALDTAAEGVGFVLSARFASWDRRPWSPGDGYVVSVHRAEPRPPVAESD